MPVDIAKALEKLGLEVRHKGRRYWTEYCPLPTHGHPNPAHVWQNFFVRSEEPRAGQYHCYSCKAGGTLTDLVMVRLNMREPAEAFAWLLDVGDAPAVPYLRVRFEPVGAAGRRFQMPPEVVTEPTGVWPASVDAYATKRGITPDQVARWRIGYAFDGRLAHRIVFPIWDGAGRLANYAARTFVDDETRYLAAPEWQHPDKSALYGEHRWPSIAHRRVGIVFEGALNGLALERAMLSLVGGAPGFADGTRVPELVGLMGSRFDHRKAAKMGTFQWLIHALDPDKAGDEASADIRGALRRVGHTRLEYPERGVDANDLPQGVLARAVLTALRAIP